MPTYLNLLQVVENLDDVLTDHERVISILGIQVDPVSTVRISFIFLLDLHLIRDIFLIRLLSVLERKWVVGYFTRRRCHNIYDQDKLRQALDACLEFSPCFGLAWQRQQRP